MASYYQSADYCYAIVLPLYDEIQSSPQLTVNLTNENINSLKSFCHKLYETEAEDGYSKPMVWIGIYISIASLFCILAMELDLLYGFRNRKFWFPCKYFSLNAASITVITVAMKLPVDLSSPMSGSLDQVAKLGGSALMCTILSNLMPSLASMDNKSLFANVIGLSILVITIIVNIFIQLRTGVIEHEDFSLNITKYTYLWLHFMMITYVYIGMLLFLQLILISSAIIIPSSKKILEFKYKATSKTALNDQHLMSIVEKLRLHVKKYWIMAETGSPQFVMASNPLSFASGIICVVSLMIYIFVLAQVLWITHDKITYRSEYTWSVIAIIVTQSIGVIVGSIAPIFRCFTILSFKSFAKWNRNHFLVFKVDKYWTQKLCEWKESHINILSSGPRLRKLLQHLKNIILSFFIGVQKVNVVSCKVLGIIPIAVIIFFVYCSYYFKSLKAMLFISPISLRIEDPNEDLSNYVLLLEDNMGLAENTLRGISNSMNLLIKKEVKKQHVSLLKLLEKSTSFEGVAIFDTDQVQALLSVEPLHSWSLPIVTLTCIAITLPNIHKDLVDSLFKGVSEGLFYTHLVEESLNSASEYVNTRRETMTLWYDVEDNGKWLEKTLEKRAYEGKSSREILKSFARTAEEIVIDIIKSTNGEHVDNLPRKLTAANSMYRVTQTIMHTYKSSTIDISEEQLFKLLSQMIADILAACLTNIPRVITMKCHESSIEKRVASVVAAAKLLGRTTEIIKRLEDRELPNMDPDKMAFIDEWRLHLKQCIP